MTRRVVGLALLWAAFALLVWTFCVPQTPVDDAYITFRYVRHFAAGDGLVFNRGEGPLEGYSSLLWVLVLAPFSRLGVDLTATAHGLGLLFGMATLAVVALGGPRERPRFLGASALIVCLPWLYHVVNGLETGLVALLIALLTCLSPTTPRRRRWLGLVAVLLPLARPEGLIAVLVWSAASQLASRRWQRHALMLAAFAFAAFSGQLAFRLGYHHEWIANSARAKMLPLGVALLPGLLDVGRFLLTATGVGLGVLLALAAGGLRADDSADVQPRVRLVFIALFAPILATSGGDSFPLWRFFVPIAPVLLTATDDGVQLLLSRRAWPERTKVLAHGLVGLVLLTLLMGPWQLLLPMLRLEGQWVKRWAAIGTQLGQILPPTTTIALAPVGALPYQANFRVIDLLGLNDAHIAHRPPDSSYFYPGHQRHDGPYVLSRRPDLIFLANGPVVQDPAQPFPWQEVRVYEQDLLRDPALKQDYHLVALPIADGLFLQILARKDFVDAQHPTWRILDGMQPGPL